MKRYEFSALFGDLCDKKNLSGSRRGTGSLCWVLAAEEDQRPQLGWHLQHPAQFVSHIQVQPLLMKSWQQNTSSAIKQGKVTNSNLEINWLWSIFWNQFLICLLSYFLVSITAASLQYQLPHHSCRILYLTSNSHLWSCLWANLSGWSQQQPWMKRRPLAEHLQQRQPWVHLWCQ